MRIYPVNNVPSGSLQPTTEQNFGGIWMRHSKYYINNTNYCAGVFHSYKDGKHLTVFRDRLGRTLKEKGSCGLTKKEGKQIWEFLFENNETMNGYLALKKLRGFILQKTYKNDKGILYMEKEDSALITSAKEKLNLSVINKKIEEFERKNNLLPKPQPEPFIKRKRITTPDELLDQIYNKGPVY
ncbi:hypothetical protein J6S88_03535 [bacterium]|nr:hypothetical protein [bacterium]